MREILLPVFEDHLVPVLLAVSEEWFVHAEHLRNMLPSRKEQLQWHDSWLQSRSTKIPRLKMFLAG